MELRHSLKFVVSLAKVCEFLKFPNEDLPDLPAKPLPRRIFYCPETATNSTKINSERIVIKKKLAPAVFNATEEAEKEGQEDTQGRAIADDMFMQRWDFANLNFSQGVYYFLVLLENCSGDSGKSCEKHSNACWQMSRLTRR